MKTTLLIILAFFALPTWSQIDVKITGNIFNSGVDTVYLIQNINGRTVTLISAPMLKDGTFELKGTVPAPDYYSVVVKEYPIHVILRQNSDFQIYGDGSNLDQFLNIVNSTESDNMHKFVRQQDAWAGKIVVAQDELKINPSKKSEINQSMKVEGEKFQNIQKNFIRQNSNSAALYPVLNSIDINSDFASYELIVNQLTNNFSQSPTIQKLAKQFEAYKVQLQANDKFAPGKPAPDFEETKIDGTTMKLSDLKGKVVLIDFWASWCGPCRRENPAVVKLYHKYKDDGFTIISVSLDKDKAKWMAAIEKDNLTWPNHVSDLKFWQSKVARMYGVNSIPYTVLIDKEGNIIRTKLRSHDLAVELERIFGH